jgi:hypothetical protein
MNNAYPKRSKALGLPALCLALLLAGGVAAESVSLQIGEPANPAALPLREAPEALRPSTPEAWLVFGRLAMTGFSVAEPSQVQLQDGEGRPLPLLIESNTLYREFGEIAGMTIAFELDPRALSGGLPVLTWGPGVAATNRLLPALAFAPDSSARLRQFTLQAAAPNGGEAPRFATIAIIADSKADRYYLWYLLPMAMIFGLLVIRKLWKP